MRDTLGATSQANIRNVTYKYGSRFARFGKHSMLLYVHGMHACMRVACKLVSPTCRRSGLDSTGRGVAPAAHITLFALEDNQSSASARTHQRRCIEST